MNLSLQQLPLPKSKTNKAIQDHKRWGALSGSSDALAITALLVQHQGPLVVITADTPSAMRLERTLRFFIEDKDLAITLFPDWETLPYDAFSPHQDIVSQRLETLYQLTRADKGVFIVPVNTLMQRVAPTDYLAHEVIMFEKGQSLDRDNFRRQLEEAGYLHVNQVMSHSEFSVRGSIIDLFPMGSEQPFRLDLFDDEIDTIRYFDPDTQRSAETVDKIRLLPAREFPTDKEALKHFRQRYLDKFGTDNPKDSVLPSISKGTLVGGIEYYLPLFFEQTATLFDYLHPNASLIIHGNVQTSAQRHWEDINNRFEQLRYNLSRPLLSPDDVFIDVHSILSAFKQWPRLSLSDAHFDEKAGTVNADIAPVANITVNSALKQPYSGIVALLSKAEMAKGKMLFVAESTGRRENMLEILAKANIKPTLFSTFSEFIKSKQPIGITIGWLDSSFVVDENKRPLYVISETELLGHKVSQRRRREKQQATDENAIIRNLAELSIGQPVVHLDHGIGRYQGLQTLDAGGVSTEYLHIEYANAAKLYVPVASLHLISRYTGGDVDTAPLNHLGTDAWAKAKKKAAEKVRDVAAELLNVYAKRAAKPGFAYAINWQEYEQFADSFPFEETPDQQQAIAAVLNDMGTATAMDRLVCGDVGFGKTEVAMRAAFIAANQGKQVAILVPTTLLAQQHYENFKDRFSSWPFRIEVMSRFVSGKTKNQVMDGIEQGTVDIVVGTHKLLQDDMRFADLGLVIIDEEHRFGVRQKEKFKALRTDVDILTLTATPIPRTLNMALSGMRDLSIIATPPAKRLSIKTFVQQRNEAVIREAIMREILRGGQVYFLHNEVETIERTAQEIADIVPEARIAIGHGQMRERELESVMSDFYHQRFNVLVCTTIVETGIDVPTANTIIMDRADHLGLAQLHQLRGRVGRSHHQAYAYLLTPHPRRMTKDATKRLEAIASLENLGAGFALATHDLEIRGAGELLGDDQSGQITSVGFSLYMDMLDQAVEALKQGKEPSLDDALAKQTEVELRIPALLPDDYINDVNQRLSLYKKFANCQTQGEINEVQIECIDRFGLLPTQAKNLVETTILKVRAKQLGIEKIDINAQGGVIAFNEKMKVDPGFIIQLVQQNNKEFRFEGSTKLKWLLKTDSAEKRLKKVSALLDKFEKELIAV
ncbi:transcription-repair coupling factor [Alteromonas sediminis]|uniref:Transcription-repair-coupling factor n=1 Tax=Alteromonas sediminis TaxID=2259342 RepID=A0A3N5Y3A9_9ALTE|nr:transcription-repair coupling factor [Alteromonas sediminis]RPJ67256.1 transcription-repair coupling factor [Alteromonas sediminis]